MRQHLAILIILSLLLTGCFGAPPADAPPADAPTAAAQAAAPQAVAPTSAPTDTALPPTDTPTAEPVAFVFPSPTPEPTPTPVPPSCAEQAAAFTAQANALLREWDDALLLADSTPRIQLADQVEKLQALRRRAEDLAPPDCAAQIKGLMLDGMNSAIEGFIDFMGDTESFGAGLIKLSKYQTDAAQHALGAMAAYPGTLEPFTVDDVKAMLPQYTWEDRTSRDGETYISAVGAPIEVQASHENGIVYSLYLGATLYDDDAADYADVWPTIQATALTFLPGWADGEAWLTDFGAAEPTDALEPVVTHADVTTIRADHVRYEMIGMESASVAIQIPHKGAAGE